MKKLLIIAISVASLYANCSGEDPKTRRYPIDPMRPGERGKYIPVSSPQTLSQSGSPLEIAAKTLDEYAQSASLEALNSLKKYFGYYKSWYSSVTPAPRELIASLSDVQKQLVENIKNIAEQFKQSKSAGYGSSSLNEDGQNFYQGILAQLDQLIKQKQNERGIVGSALIGSMEQSAGLGKYPLY